MPIDQDPGAGRGEEDGNPLPPSWAESEMAESLEEERPRNRVERLGNVELEEDSKQLAMMKVPGGLLDKEEIIVDATARDECALVWGDHLPKHRGEPEGENLRKELCKEVNQADRPVVGEGGGVWSLGEQREESLVQPLEALPV